MKKIFNTILTISILSLLVLTSCDSTPQTESNGLTVLASTSFLADIAQNVAGDRLQVQSLLPIGADPHAYQPVPADIAKIAESDLLILNGLEYEHFIESLLENAGGERVVVEATTGLTSHEAEEKNENILDYVCRQISEKNFNTESGVNAESAVLLESGEEHSHDRDIFNVRLHPQADGSYAGYLFFDANAKEEEYVFTSPEGKITVYSLANIALVSQSEFDIDCAKMTHAISYNLYVGRYIVGLSGFNSEIISFSATSIHFGEEEHTDGHDEDEEHVDEAESGEGHEHEAGDPHLWLDPNFVITYVENIRDGLIQVDPHGKAIYEKNAVEYINQLEALDVWIVEQVNLIPEDKRLLVTNHEALNYFAERYGFEVVGTVLPSASTNAQPSAQQMAQLIDDINAIGVPAIFLSDVENATLAEQIASETDVKIIDDLYLESLTVGAPAGTYLDMMRHNVNLIVDALK